MLFSPGSIVVGHFKSFERRRRRTREWQSRMEKLFGTRHARSRERPG